MIDYSTLPPPKKKPHKKKHKTTQQSQSCKNMHMCPLFLDRGAVQGDYESVHYCPLLDGNSIALDRPQLN